MREYYENMSAVQLREYVGDISQLANAREGRLTDGRSDGMRRQKKGLHIIHLLKNDKWIPGAGILSGFQ